MPVLATDDWDGKQDALPRDAKPQKGFYERLVVVPRWKDERHDYYDPDEARDDSGRWTSGGGEGSNANAIAGRDIGDRTLDIADEAQA